MSEPRISDLLATASSPLLSFEFFPPRDPDKRRVFDETIGEFRVAAPDFVTVTYGAGGSTRAMTLELCETLRAAGFGPVMPHLACVGSSREEVARLSDEWARRGTVNVMTLRGDPPADADPARFPSDFEHASDLVCFLRERHPDWCCGVAGYPETHPQAASPEQDIQFLKVKLMAGASFVTTQLFFTNAVYFDFVDRCRRAGITQPILPGLLPAISLPQAQRMCAMCRVRLPEQLQVDLEDAGGTGPAAEAVGIRWAASQIRDLLARGAPGIHLYVLNRARTALAPDLLRCLEKVRRPARKG